MGDARLVPARQLPVEQRDPDVPRRLVRDAAFFLRASNRNKGLGFNEWFATDNLGFRVVWPAED